ncbi:hypothetical protein VN23_02335 [Janthinobacterium sp. B9-8]|nr:hypothetical protein VN23_02335 [Janthinobacterium sp. B9-8]
MSLALMGLERRVKWSEQGSWLAIGLSVINMQGVGREKCFILPAQRRCKTHIKCFNFAPVFLRETLRSAVSSVFQGLGFAA